MKENFAMMPYTVMGYVPNEVIVTIGEKQLKLQCDFNQFLSASDEYDAGALMQDAFHFLSPDEREFLISGLLPDDFDRFVQF
jgi:hypothetical protein